MKNTLTALLCCIMFAAVLNAQESESNELKPALLVIDVQNKYMPMMSEEDSELAVEMINWSIWMFRQYGLPVIRIYHSNPEHATIPGNEEFEFDDRIKVIDTDPMVIKTYGSAFNKTQLDSLLQANDINALYLCGLSSVGCVLATHMDAANYDYQSFLIKDAILSHKANYTDQIEEIMDAIDLNTINFMFGYARGIEVENEEEN